MKCYIVTIGSSDDTVRQKVSERMQAFREHCRVHENCWAVMSDQAAPKIRDHVAEILDRQAARAHNRVYCSSTVTLLLVRLGSSTNQILALIFTSSLLSRSARIRAGFSRIKKVPNLLSRTPSSLSTNFLSSVAVSGFLIVRSNRL